MYVEGKLGDERPVKTLPVTLATSAVEEKVSEMHSRSRTQPHTILLDRTLCVFVFLLHKGDKITSSNDLMHTLALRTQWRAGTASITLVTSD